MARKQRLDLELVARGLAASRQQAQQWIRAGKVRQGDRVLDKPGSEVAPELELQVERPPRFVSRGGEKLVAALEGLPIRVQDRVCLDGGISTGGFTDCLLQHGARRVYGIDVGYSQTAWSLRTDPRVVLRERTNLRHLTPDQLLGPQDPWPDLAVADVSFISLTQVLPALWRLLGGSDPTAADRPGAADIAAALQTECGDSQGAAQASQSPGSGIDPSARGGRSLAGEQGRSARGEWTTDAPRGRAPRPRQPGGVAHPLGRRQARALESRPAALPAACEAAAQDGGLAAAGPAGPREAVLLIKPQFEVGRERVGRGGVVRDPAAHCDAIERVITAAQLFPWRAAGLLASPITGPAGNHEYLLWLREPVAADLADGGQGSEALICDRRRVAELVRRTLATPA
jgi:TlyA family rRNA methyltransferase/putative hemolysin